MNLSSFSLKHPIAIIIIVIGLVVIGALSLTQLNMDMLPNVGMPTIAVITYYPGAGPEEIEKNISIPIEDALAEISGVEKIESSSVDGASILSVYFTWGANLDEAFVNIREQINMIINDFPEGAYIPELHKFNASMLPVYIFSVTGKQSIDFLKNFVDNEIKPKLKRIDGVSLVKTIGGRKKVVEISLNLTLMESKNISMSDVIKVLKYENVNFPAGYLVIQKKDYIVRTIGEFQSLDDIKNMTVGYNNGAFIKLGEIANIDFNYLDSREIARTPNGNSILISVNKQSNKNAVKVIKKLKRTLSQIEEKYKNKIKFLEISNQESQIKNSIGSVSNSALTGGILAIIILFLFLRNIRSTLIISIAIPISIVITFLFMNIIGQTLNILTLAGLSLGVGMLVDSSIVVLENIFRHFNLDKTRSIAAESGAKEVSTAIIASVLTTIAVFLPLVTVRGIAGIIFRDLSITVSISLIISLIVALTVIPILSSKLLKKDIPTKKIRIFNFIEKLLEKLENFYSSVISKLIYKRKTVIIFAILLFVASLYMIKIMGYEFLAPMDQGEFFIITELPVGSTLQDTENKIKKIERIVTNTLGEDYRAMVTIIGNKDKNGLEPGSNVARSTVRMSVKNKRKTGLIEYLEILREKCKDIPNVKTSFQVGGLGALMSYAVGDDLPLSLIIKGEKLDSILSFSKKVLKIAQNTDGIRDAQLSIEDKKPEKEIRILKKQAGTLGISSYEIAITTRAALNGLKVGKYNGQNNDLELWIRLRNEDRNNTNNLNRIFIKNPNNDKISLGTVTKIVSAYSPTKITRQNKKRYIKLQANVLDRDVYSAVQEIMQKTNNISKPKDITIERSGGDKEMMKSFKSLGIALVLAIFLVYIVMVVQFESFLHPFVVMFSIPFAFIGVTLGLLFGHSTFSIVAFLGLMTLSGIVVNNAIVLIDYINQLRKRDIPLEEAVVKAAKTRLKPILMTTLTTVLGLLPMSMGLGAGSEIYAPMGQAIVGGLITSTLITLILIPVLFVTTEKLKNKFYKKKGQV